jgi:hypothetical protein
MRSLKKLSIWLREGKEEDRGALSLFPLLTRISNQQGVLKGEDSPASSFQKDPEKASGIILESVNTLAELCLNRNYWMRVGLFKVALARKVILFCGGEGLDWTVFGRLFCCFTEKWV